MTVFLAPACPPELKALDGLWAHVKHSLTSPASVALDPFETLVRNRLKHLRYRPDVLDGFLARSGLNLQPPPQP